MNKSKSQKEEYIERELFANASTLAPTLILISVFIDLSLSLLDYFVTPENFLKFFVYRALTVFSMIVLYFLLKIYRGPRFLSFSVTFATLITAVMVELMILALGGHQSVYYAGMIIVLAFVLGFLPISVKMAVAVATVVYSIYLFPILFLDKIVNVRIFINNNIFLLAAALGGISWRYVSQKLLIKNLSLQYDLDQQNKQLEVYSTQLKSLVDERTKELHKSEQWHRSIVDNATDGIIILNRNGVIINANERASQMHDFPREALIGAHFKLVENGARQEETDERMRRLLLGESMVFESVHKKKDGTPVYLEVSSKAITIAGEVFIQSFYRDITEKKKIQEHLFQSQKIESIGILAGGIAHDFNNVLTAILGHSEIIRRNNLDEKQVRSLNVIEEASRRAGRMVSKLLGFARKSNNEIVPLNMNDVIFDSIKLLERVIDKKINLSVELDHTLPPVQGDPSQIEQVIMNLVVNARDAMPNGGRIVIRTRFREIVKGLPDVPPYVAPGEYVLLSVIDTGAGIPKEVVDKIFEPFFTTKERGKGTGLGLSMVYGAIKTHKGYISVQSEPGKGTNFTIYIPASQAVVPREEKKQVRSISGSETVLIIDDEQDILQSIQDTLTTHGYKVFAISDPASGINIFQKLSGEIALVITDIVMPKLNGKELIAQLKSINSSVKILAISGYTKYVAPKEEIGEINGFLQKPFESYYLLTVVRRILDEKPRQDVMNLF